MQKFMLILTFMFVASGCGTMKAYLPIIDASIVGGKGVVLATRDHTVEKQDLAGCYVTSALITALDSSKTTIDSWVASTEGDKVIPGVEVDIAVCHALAGDKIEPVVSEEANQKVQGIMKAVLPSVVGVLGAVLESSDVNCRDLVIAKGILKYVENAAPVVVDELANPDGKMSLPSVVLEFGSCDVSSAAPAPEKTAAPQCE